MSGPDRKAIISGLLRLLEGAQDAATVEVQFSRGGRVVFELPSPPRHKYDPQSCEADILEVLRIEARRLTTMELLAAMARHNKEWGESTVKVKLAELVDEGDIDNDPKAKPRGYGLPLVPCLYAVLHFSLETLAPWLAL